MGSPDFVHPDVVWGVITEPSHLPGAVAARTLAAKLGVPWVFELHDPCPHPGGRLARLEEQAFRSCLESCAAVVTTTEALADHLVADNPCCIGKTLPLHLSYDDNETRSAQVQGCGGPLRLLHAGTLTGGTGRSATALLHALRRALEVEPTLRGQVRLDLLGGGQGIAEAVGLASRLGIADMLTAPGGVPQAQAVRVMDEADVLVAIKYPDPRYDVQIPGKIFQYMGRGEPILGIMGECEAAQVLRCTGLAEIIGHNDIEHLANQIVHYWRNRDRLSELYRPNREYIRQFSRSAMAERLNALLTKLVEDAKTGS